jgi:hypothetical protein
MQSTNFFNGTSLSFDELTQWIKGLDVNNRINEIRYFGSRCFGTPRPDSDIDVYLLMEECDDDDDPFALGPLFSKTYKGYTIEFHPMIDFHDGYVPAWLLQHDAENQLAE